MKSRSIATLSTLVLVAMMALAPVAQGQGEWKQEFPVKSGQKIELEMKQGGSLEVEGWDRDLVRVVCTSHKNDNEDGGADIKNWDIEVTKTSGGLRLSAKPDRKFRSLNFNVHLNVPRKFNIESHSGGGSISITDVSGIFQGATGGGGITLKNLSGQVHLTTGGGGIKVLDSDLDGKVSTGGGGGLVRNVVGNVKVTSGGGIVSFENVSDRGGDLRGPGGLSPAGTSPKTIMYSTAGGGIDLDDAPEGAIVKTGGGDIDIRNASRFVKARTGGGDIDIQIKDGYVEAKTGAGDIHVSVAGGLGKDGEGIELKTGTGEVTLVLPADASIDLDLDLAYTRNSSQDFEIKSDFDLQREHSQKWDSKHGSPLKHIYGTATINGGKHKVVIHNVNGNIRIQKR